MLSLHENWWKIINCSCVYCRFLNESMPRTILVNTKYKAFQHCGPYCTFGGGHLEFWYEVSEYKLVSVNKMLVSEFFCYV